MEGNFLDGSAVVRLCCCSEIFRTGCILNSCSVRERSRVFGGTIDEMEGSGSLEKRLWYHFRDFPVADSCACKDTPPSTEADLECLATGAGSDLVKKVLLFFPPRGERGSIPPPPFAKEKKSEKSRESRAENNKGSFSVLLTFLELDNNGVEKCGEVSTVLQSKIRKLRTPKSLSDSSKLLSSPSLVLDSPKKSNLDSSSSPDEPSTPP